jgi:hypothetical protein
VRLVSAPKIVAGESTEFLELCAYANDYLRVIFPFELPRRAQNRSRQRVTEWWQSAAPPFVPGWSNNRGRTDAATALPSRG